MRYIDSYDDDEDGEGNDFEEVEAEMMAEAIHQSNKNREEEVKLAKIRLRSELMDKAIFICKSHWFWGLMSHDHKMLRIAEAYESLIKLMEI